MGHAAVEDQAAVLLSTREVALRLGVSTETVLRWTRSGELPGFRLPGGALRYRQEELEVWLNGRATTRRGTLSHHEDAVRPGKLATMTDR